MKVVPEVQLEAISNEVLSTAELMAALDPAALGRTALVSVRGNTGDGLIQLGANALIRRQNLDVPVIRDTEIANLPEGTTLVVPGGALIEGVWEDRVRALRPHLVRGGRVVLLGYTVLGFAELISKHGPQIQAFVRDLPSLENVRSAGGSATLIHDLAFLVDPAFYVSLARAGSGTLSVFRTDDERARSEIPFGNLDLSLLWNDNDWEDPQRTEERCRLLGQILSHFAEIETDRLHIAIFSALLGKTVRLHATAGGKTESIFRRSLHRFPNVSFVPAEDSPAEGWEPRDRLMESARELARLRREWYEPELARLQSAMEEFNRTRLEWYEPQLERLQSALAAEVARNRELLELRQTNARLRARLIHVAGSIDRERASSETEVSAISTPNKVAAEPDVPTNSVQREVTREPERPRKRPRATFLRALRMAGYALVPVTRKRRARRRAMLEAIWSEPE